MQEATEKSGKRIAKNTLMLYIRMFIMLGISLYTSRVILHYLGINDFGIYNLVGGIVALMSFLNSSMANATSRFLTFDIGRNDSNHLKKTFSSALQLHLAIAAIVLIVGEAVGVWFINTHLNIPNDRIFAANCVFQMSLLISVMTIVQVPFSATLIAHERIDIYAIIEIANVCMKLLAVYMLVLIGHDRLITYSALLLCVAVMVFITYRTCCTRRYEECHLSRSVHKEIIRPMLAFSGWDLYGNGCVVARQQGTNILLNQFFGVALNAASGIATQVSAAISLFISNITMAIRPQIIKRYAADDIVGMQKLLSLAIIVCLILVECIMLPIYLNIDTLLDLWLKDVPKYAPEFCKCMLIANSIMIFNTLFNIPIHASGKVKYLSIIGGSLFLSTVLLSYIGFLFIDNPLLAYIIWVATIPFLVATSVIIAKRNIREMSILSILKDAAVPLSVAVAVIAITCYINGMLEAGIIRIISVTLINALLMAAMLYLFWILPKYKGNIKAVFKSLS